MKSKIVLLVFTLVLNLTATLYAAPVSEKMIEEKVLAMTTEQKEARIAAMKQRLEQIETMDRSQLSKSERKALREELKNMNKEAKAIRGHGIYLSVGAIIIIILLLILLL